jgi:hypothetical protein
MTNDDEAPSPAIALDALCKNLAFAAAVVVAAIDLAACVMDVFPLVAVASAIALPLPSILPAMVLTTSGTSWNILVPAW